MVTLNPIVTGPTSVPNALTTQHRQLKKEHDHPGNMYSMWRRSSRELQTLRLLSETLSWQARQQQTYCRTTLYTPLYPTTASKPLTSQSNLCTGTTWRRTKASYPQRGRAHVSKSVSGGV